MKLYTEEQVRFIIQEAREVDWWEQKFDFTVEDITTQLTPIELPSDEEIEKAGRIEYNLTMEEICRFKDGVEYLTKFITK